MCALANGNDGFRPLRLFKARIDVILVAWKRAKKLIPRAGREPGHRFIFWRLFFAATIRLTYLPW